MPTTALYHPWIDPTNGATIRTAILYWDRMRTITPASVEMPYDNPHTLAAHELGFLRPYHVDQQNRHVIDASKEFERDFGRRPIKKYMKQARKVAAMKGEPPDWMSGMKVSMEFERRFFRSGAVQRNGMYGVADGFGLPYMARLAATIASAEDMTAYSDQQLSHDVVQDRYVHDAERDKIAKAEATLAHLAIETITIPSTVSLWRLWDFRQQHEKELNRFREAIREQAIQVGSYNDPEQFYEAAKRLVQKKVAPAKEELAAKLKERGIEYTTHVMEGLCAAGAGYAIGRNLASALAGLGVKVTWSGVRAGITISKARNDPFAYLLRARKQFVD